MSRLLRSFPLVMLLGLGPASVAGEPLIQKQPSQVEDYSASLLFKRLSYTWVRGGPTACFSLSFAPDGKSLAWSGPTSTTICIADVSRGKTLLALQQPMDGIRFVTHSPDGKYLAAVAEMHDLVYLWDATTGEPIEAFNQQSHSAGAIGFSADGKHLQAWCRGGTFRVWECPDGTETRSATLPKAQLDLVVMSPDGSRLAAFDKLGEQSQILCLPNLHGAVSIKGDLRSPYAAAFAPSGTMLATGMSNGRIHLWNTRTGAEIGQWNVSKKPIQSLAFSPDGRTLAVSCWYESAVRLIEVYSHCERAKLDGHKRVVEALAFSPDGRLLASGSTDETCALWDLTGRSVARLPETVNLVDTEMAALWENLQADNAGLAWRSIWALAAGGDTVAGFLNEKATPAEKSRPDRLAKLIADLDSDEFESRQGASAELGRIRWTHWAVETALRKALDAKPSLEVQRRIEDLLEAPGKGEFMRDLRAVEVLEQIGTQQALKVLDKLAGGGEEATLTLEAKASRDRLAARKQKKGSD